jgi:CRISPR/Cas system-associated endonuclease Cas3-HD
MDTDGSDPYPELDLADLIGLTPDAAIALAEAKGVERIRANEVVDGVIAGPIDMMLARNRLDLAYKDGYVVYASLPTVRSAGALRSGPEANERPEA